MQVAVLGSSGRTGRLVVAELLRRGHEVTAVVRDPAKAPVGTEVVVGDAADPDVLAQAVRRADAVVSALGPVGRQPDLHRRTVAALVPAMRTAGVRRYVGLSGAGTDAPGDHKRPKDRVISALVQRLPGEAVADKAGELAAWQASDLDWTLVRPPRLNDEEPTGALEHDAHASTRSTSLSRADLATFVVDALEQGWYLRSAPFVANLPKARRR